MKYNGRYQNTLEASFKYIFWDSVFEVQVFLFLCFFYSSLCLLLIIVCLFTVVFCLFAVVLCVAKVILVSFVTPH